jgi:hypothetical protein
MPKKKKKKKTVTPQHTQKENSPLVADSKNAYDTKQ